MIFCLFALLLWLVKVIENDRTVYGQHNYTSCDTVGTRRKFYYTQPREDSSYFDRTGYWVPNIVHYIWYSETPQPFRFHHMLSVLSAHRYIQPEVILFHTNMEPTGEFWDRVRALPSLRVVKRQHTLCFNDHLVNTWSTKEGPADLDRMRVLSETGGIYMDLDVIAIRSFDPIRRFPCTIGLEKTVSPKVCGALIVCSNESLFLHYWRQQYVDDNRPLVWAYNTGQVPTDLWKKYPDLIHMENTSFLRPNYRELDQLWLDKPYHWQNNYAVHLWYHSWKHMNGFFDSCWFGSAGLKDWFFWGTEPSFENIRTWKGTFGEMARYVLYGSPVMIRHGDPQLYEPSI